MLWQEDAKEYVSGISCPSCGLNTILYIVYGEFASTSVESHKDFLKNHILGGAQEHVEQFYCNSCTLRFV